MKYQCCLLILLNCALVSFAVSDYRCSDNFPVVTDLSQNECDLESKYFDSNYDDCFPGCYTAGKNSFISRIICVKSCNVFLHSLNSKCSHLIPNTYLYYISICSNYVKVVEKHS